MKKIFILYLGLSIIGLIIFFNLTISNFNNLAKLKEITIQEDCNIQITDAYNERGIYILNDEYFLSSSTFIIGNTDSLSIVDDAIWRPKEYKHKPRISDIEAPFTLFKKKNNDTLNLIRGRDTLLLKIEKSNSTD